ncbi:MAG: hypothetical protein AABZ39_06820 [Spirochaetota bacterium]
MYRRKKRIACIIAAGMICTAFANAQFIDGFIGWTAGKRDANNIIEAATGSPFGKIGPVLHLRVPAGSANAPYVMKKISARGGMAISFDVRIQEETTYRGGDGVFLLRLFDQVGTNDYLVFTGNDTITFGGDQKPLGTFTRGVWYHCTLSIPPCGTEDAASLSITEHGGSAREIALSGWGPFSSGGTYSTMQIQTGFGARPVTDILVGNIEITGDDAMKQKDTLPSGTDMLKKISERRARNAARAKTDKLIISHYMPCMSVGCDVPGLNGGIDTTDAQVTQNFSEPPTLPNGTMATHIDAYLVNTRRPLEAARQDIAMAKACGVNTFGCLLGNSHLPASYAASMIHALFNAAAEDGDFKIAPDIWANLESAPMLEKIGNELLILKQHEKSWRRYRGKLLVTMWTDYGRGKLFSYPEAMKLLFDRIGGRDAVFLVLYTPATLKEKNPLWFAGADAYTDWFHADYGHAIQERAKAEDCVDAAGKEFWYPVMPSFTQSRPPLTTPNVREKLGMVNFIDDWRTAIAVDAPVVMIPTWNDLSEDSALMPESNHGFAFYELNKFYAAWLNTGALPKIENEKLLLFHHPQVAGKVLLPAGGETRWQRSISSDLADFYRSKEIKREPMGAFAWATTTPPTDYIGITVALKEPAKVLIRFCDKALIAEREFPAGLNSWFVYHPSPHKPDAVYPKDSADLAVTVLDKPFWDTEVFVYVYRDGKRIGLYRSHRPIVEAAARGEMQTVGDAFDIPQR